MRSLIIYRNAMGDTVCSMLTHEVEFDLSDMDDVGRIELAVDSESILFAIEMPNDEFRPAVMDQYGDEVAMQSVNM